MLKLCDRIHCSGCSVCHDVCPRGAISMIADKEGFLYPRIDENKCINCGLCARACSSNNRFAPRTPLAVYAAKVKDAELRLVSSSGGVFSFLARQILAKGGKVYGAAFDKRDWSVEHIGVSDEEELAELRGSKYVQSRTAGIYRDVKAALQSGIPVLFTGTPCQIAALRAYLNLQPLTSTSNLYLVDVVCHGVPSPMVWQKYLDWQCEAALAQGRGSAPAEGRNIRRISFRRKNCGWKRYSLSLRFANDKEYLCQFHDDPYMQVFLSELISRPSCHACFHKGQRSGADITLGDFWGIDTCKPDFYDERGISAVLINTPKGEFFWSNIRSYVDSVHMQYDDVVRENSALVISTKANRRRGKFFNLLLKKPFDVLVRNVTTSSKFRVVVGKVLRKIGLLG